MDGAERQYSLTIMANIAESTIKSACDLIKVGSATSAYALHVLSQSTFDYGHL